MFVLTELCDTVAILPRHFNINLNEAIDFALNKKFANKIVHNVGLCIALWDVTKVDDSFIFPGDGSSHTRVAFRFVVFRPYMDEILIGKIRNCCKEGVYVSMGFFDDVFLPADQLRTPSRFDEANQLWIWEYQAEDEKHNLEMLREDEIRFRVMDEIFVDVSPSGPEIGEAADVSEMEKKSPYTILGSIHDAGLGLISWWLEDQ